MVESAVTILGGLPVIAEVTFTRGDGWEIDDDAIVDCLYWIKSSGSRGKPVPESIYTRLEKADPYWQASVIEQVSEVLVWEAWNEKENVRELSMAPTILE